MVGLPGSRVGRRTRQGPAGARQGRPQRGGVLRTWRRGVRAPQLRDQLRDPPAGFGPDTSRADLIHTLPLPPALEAAVTSGHPWIYRDNLPSHDLPDGSIVKVE